MASLQTVAEKAHDTPNGQSIECEALRMAGPGREPYFTRPRQQLDMSTLLESHLEAPYLNLA